LLALLEGAEDAPWRHPEDDGDAVDGRPLARLAAARYPDAPPHDQTDQGFDLGVVRANGPGVEAGRHRRHRPDDRVHLCSGGRLGALPQWQGAHYADQLVYADAPMLRP
jgi:hypothetical protein